MRHGGRDLDAGELEYDNDFWRFSLAVYDHATVANECLALQAAYGIDVNILLFCAWLGTRAVVLKREDIEAASRAVAAWHESVVGPLRVVRQQTKSLSRDERFRASIKDIEIKAEQIEQAILFAFSRRLQGPSESANQHEAVARNVKEFIAMKATSAPSPNSKVRADYLIDAARRVGS